MKRMDFNQHWTCAALGTTGQEIPVTLPHDAMRTERRTAASLGGGNIGWFEGLDYVYRKRFFLPETLRGQHLELEFEGVYHRAEIEVNGTALSADPYGYTNFSVDLDGVIRWGEENEITVIAHNADQPNSRWYSGTGIYRPVWLWVGPACRIERNGIRVTTLSAAERRISVTLRGQGTGEAKATVWEGDREIAQSSISLQEGQGKGEMTLLGTELWLPEHPQLYTLRVSFGGDEAEAVFGIRTLAWNAREGLTLNGERVILRGACVHHDHGILGACAYPEAEERRVRKLQEAGYNALRSAHNPASKALLDACDRLGMLVMDEYVDCWYMHKTEHDYASQVMKWWQRDLTSLVEKDYNHPSVVMYSTGNEVAESAQEKGIALQRDFTAFLHELDATRPVTCGINIFFNFLSSIGLGVYSDEKAAKEAQAAEKQAKQEPAAAPKKKKKSVGSEFFNNMAARLGTDFMKFGAWLPPCDWKTRKVFAAMDVAGYNYGNWRYRKDCRKYPDRLILGSETLIGDARSFWLQARKHPQIIGDFVWAGWDYIGECGGDSPEYDSYRTERGEDRIRGGTCRIDITGKLTPEADYTRVVFDLEKRPRLAVVPPGEGTPQLTGWQLTRAIRSWSYPGREGQTAAVEVYTTAPRVRLWLNGNLVGQGKIPAGCRKSFRVPYAPGELRVEALDDMGKVIGEDVLRSAGAETRLRLEAESASCRPGEMIFLRVRYTDDTGEGKPLERHTVRVEAENGKVMGVANGCTFFDGNYAENHAPTYFGEAQAIVRAGDAGTVVVRVTDGERKTGLEIPCGG